MVRIISVPTPFEIGPVNICILGNGPLTIVDVGTKHPDTIKALLYEFKRLDLRLSDIGQIILTHPHPDHYGLASWLKNRTGAKILCHPYTAFRIERIYCGDVLESLRPILASFGVPEEIANGFISRDDGFNELVEKVKADMILNEDEFVDTGDKKWRVIYTPGHSRGQICLYNTQTCELISGDHLLPRISSNPMIEPLMPEDKDIPRSLEDYRESLKKIDDLRISKIYPGHGPVFADYHRKVKSIFDHHARQSIKILKSVNKGGMTIYEISKKMFPGLKGFEIFMGVSLVKGHLDLLEKEGKISFYGRNPLIVKLQNRQKQNVSF